jgi:hypothetical protein
MPPRCGPAISGTAIARRNESAGRCPWFSASLGYMTAREQSLEANRDRNTQFGSKDIL